MFEFVMMIKKNVNNKFSTSFVLFEGKTKTLKNNYIFFGDNYEVMNSDYFSNLEKKIKTIYIDPPYNTRTSKSYSDDISSDDWITYLKKRLELSLKFLKDDGILFISIDDNEYANLKILCDEILGKKNYLGTFITYQSQRSNAKYINIVHEYVVCYAKNKVNLKKLVVRRMDLPKDREIIKKLNSSVKRVLQKEGMANAQIFLRKMISNIAIKNNISWIKNYNNIDEEGNIYFATDLSTPGKSRAVSIPEINIFLDPLPTRGWCSDKKLKELYYNKRLCFKADRPYEIHYLEDAEDNIPSILNSYSRQGSEDLRKLGIYGIFDTPKPVELLKFLIRISTGQNDIILDYFAGSGSLAQAVYEINKEDDRNNKYILIQKEEFVNENNSVFDKCKEHNIIPEITNILKYRIDTYLKKENKDTDYIIVEI